MIHKIYQTWVCGDCAMVIANGTSGWGLDEAGNELGDKHASLMYRADLVLNGCPEGDPCEQHSDAIDCVYDRGFSATACGGCGSTIAGARLSAGEFI